MDYGKLGISYRTMYSEYGNQLLVPVDQVTVESVEERPRVKRALRENGTKSRLSEPNQLTLLINIHVTTESRVDTDCLYTEYGSEVELESVGRDPASDTTRTRPARLAVPLVEAALHHLENDLV